MKKITIALVTILLLLTFNPQHSRADNLTTTSSLVVTKPEESAKEKALLIRLNEIKGMDKSNLTSAEKKVLRNELLSIQREYRQYRHGEYISIGTLLVVILLLLILL